MKVPAAHVSSNDFKLRKQQSISDATLDPSPCFRSFHPRLSGRKLSKDGVVVIFAAKFRSQDRNREDARERLKELILEANRPPPPPRRPTKPTKGSIERRLKAKAGRGDIKKGRGKVEDE